MSGGGFGGGSWGGGAWGGGSGASAPQFIYETVTLTENLGVLVPLPVIAAVSLGPGLVLVTFGHDLDLTAGSPTMNPANYATTPALAFFDVAPGPTAKQVYIQNFPAQAGTFYTLTVNAARSATGDPVDPVRDTAIFAGYPIIPMFFATAQSKTKVELVFSTPMTQNAAFSDPASYTITTLSGSPIVVNSATPSGPLPIQRVTLELASNMTKSGYYVATVDDSPGAIEATNGQALLSATDVYQWAEMATAIESGPISIGISEFSGEVTTGLLGQPAGQVFFSPALETAAADSSIQIDEVALCTRAYDVYEVPDIPDPVPLTTFGVGAVTLLNDTDNVLYATAERLGQARLNIGPYLELDIWAGATDGPADATLVETIAISAGGFLNDVGFAMYPAAAAGAQSTNAVTLDGTNQYVDMGNVAALSFTNATPFSLVIWFKSGDTDGALIGKQVAATDVGYSLALTAGGKLRAELVNTSTSDELIVETIGSFNDNRWRQAILTYDGGDVSTGLHIYVNGLDQTFTVIEDTLTGSIANAVAFQLGAIEATDSFLAGTLDDAAVYDVELSQAQATTIYNAGTPGDLTSIGPTGDLVGYWLMGDGDTHPTLTDNSTNSNDGTMTNTAATDIVVDSAPTSVFTTASNLAPIGPGPTTMINLQP